MLNEMFSDEPMFGSKEDMKKCFRRLKVIITIAFIGLLFFSNELKYQMGRNAELDAEYEKQEQELAENISRLKENVAEYEIMVNELAEQYGVEQ